MRAKAFRNFVCFLVQILNDIFKIANNFLSIFYQLTNFVKFEPIIENEITYWNWNFPIVLNFRDLNQIIEL